MRLPRCSRGLVLLGDAKTDNPEEKLEAWDKAVQWGGRCMAVNKDFSDLMSQGNETERTAIRVMVVDDAGCLYWAASALGKWPAQGLRHFLKHKDTAKAYITRVEEPGCQLLLCGS